MNNKGFVKTLLIIVLLLLVMLLYYQTDETKDIVGMLISDIDVSNIDTEEIASVVEETLDENSVEITEAPTDEVVEDAVDEVKEETALVDASEMAHLLIKTSDITDKNIIDNIGKSSNDTDDEDEE
jgi:hypothetical protein